MTCTCHTSARPYLHHVDCMDAIALADAVSRHPANTSPAPGSRPVEVATAPGPARPVETHLSAGEALSPTDVAKALTSAAQAIGLLTQRVIELHAEVEQMKAQMQHSVVYVPVVGEVT